ncbi:MAG: divergent PAP2 family protein [Treponema sp.]|nr:divergent PAP2 family protein [Treponema sp.]
MPLLIAVRTEAIKGFFENPIFLSAVSSWFMAQLIKTAVVLLGGRKRSVRELLETIIWRSGGMPSSHSSMVAAIATSAAFRDGLRSDLFVVSLFFALIVMRDAMGVRRSSGIQGRMLNSLGRQLAEKDGVEFHPVKEVHGHTPLEVVIGGLMGVFIAAAYAVL